MDYLTGGPITPMLISELIEKTGGRTDCGGLSVFLGQVRADEIDGEKGKGN